MKRFSSLTTTAAVAIALCGSAAVLAQSPSQVQGVTPPEAQSPTPPMMPAEIQAPPMQSEQSPSPLQPGLTPPALTPPATPSTSAVQPPTPTPIVVDTKVDLRSHAPQSPESSADARKEAAAALAEARSACRNESDRQACLQRAREDANALKSSMQGR